MKFKKIGILGGMGPEATAEFYLRIIRIFQQKYGAKYDSDFPEMVILNLPLPEVVEDVQENVEDILNYGVKKLEAAGVDFIAIPCNTAMLFLGETSIPVVSIVEETKKVFSGKLGVLGTKATLQKKLYGDNLLMSSLESQDKITKVIMNILSGKKLKEDQSFLFSEIENLKSEGAEKVILGCTELPLLVSTEDTIDTIEILAQAVVNEATNINEEGLGGI